MGFITKESKSDGGSVLVDPTIELEGTTKLVIRHVTFRWNDQDYDLGEDIEWELPALTAHPMRVHGYLVLNRTTGDPEVFVDDWVLDGVDDSFKFEGSNWRLLMDLFSLILPANSTTLTGLDINVHKVVEDVHPERTPEA